MAEALERNLPVMADRFTGCAFKVPLPTRSVVVVFGLALAVLGLTNCPVLELLFTRRAT